MMDHLTRLLEPWIPQLEIMRHTPQNSRYHYTDVWHHTLDALCSLNKWDPSVYWAVLLHDSGKPKVKTTDSRGDHFKFHEAESARIARKVFNKLRMPKKTTNEAVKLIEKHDAFYAPRPLSLWKLRVKAGFDDALVEKLFQVQQADILAHTIQDRQIELDVFKDYYEKEKHSHPFSVGELKINGDDVRSHTGLQGKQIGQALNEVLKGVICDSSKDTREGQLGLLEKAAKRIEEEQRQEEVVSEQ